MCEWVHSESRAAPALTGSRTVSLVVLPVAALVVLVIALDGETIPEIVVNALVAYSRNTATMDRTVTAERSWALWASRSTPADRHLARAFAEGQAMTLEEAVEYALRDEDE